MPNGTDRRKQRRISVMKKTTFAVLSAVILIALAVTAIILFGSKPKENGKVGTMVVNGEEISDAEVFFYDDYVAVPLVKLLETLGYSTEWKEDGIALISGQNGAYDLDIAGASFTKDGGEFDMIGEDPLFCKKYDKEIVLDDTTAMSIFQFMNYENAYFSEDYEALKVYISIY